MMKSTLFMRISHKLILQNLLLTNKNALSSNYMLLNITKQIYHIYVIFASSKLIIQHIMIYFIELVAYQSKTLYTSDIKI